MKVTIYCDTRGTECPPEAVCETGCCKFMCMSQTYCGLGGHPSSQGEHCDTDNCCTEDVDDDGGGDPGDDGKPGCESNKCTDQSECGYCMGPYAGFHASCVNGCCGRLSRLC